VIVGAHPDDETIGAGARLAHAASAHVVVLTDGAPSDRRFYPAVARGLSRSAYARMRRAETVAALRLAGIDESRIVTLGGRDQEAVFEMVTLTQRLLSIVAELRPEVLVSHAYEGGHPDHDTAAFVAHAVAALMRERGGEAPLVLEMTSYFDRAGVSVRGEFIPAEGVRSAEVTLDEEDRRLKQSMLSTYASQREVLGSFGVALERFRTAPRYDFGSPPHDGTLHYARAGFPVAPTLWRGLARAATRRLGLTRERFL
jgi:LmbE family N-acetylglucosaminyl deacetylase